MKLYYLDYENFKLQKYGLEIGEEFENYSKLMEKLKEILPKIYSLKSFPQNPKLPIAGVTINLGTTIVCNLALTNRNYKPK